MCVVCGSFGLGAEGRLLACAQCGQCYHPFCVGIKVQFLMTLFFYNPQKSLTFFSYLRIYLNVWLLHWQITKVVLSKGWRCLECTVCEACGQATDPGRLLLCDDCDISYHTYCLDPPLQNVPKDSWKCKWWAIFKSLKREFRRNDLKRTEAVRTWNCWMHNCCFCFVDLCLWFESEQIEIYLIILKKVDLIFNTIHQMQLNWLLCQTRNSFFFKNPLFVVFCSEVQLPWSCLFLLDVGRV